MGLDGWTFHTIHSLSNGGLRIIAYRERQKDQQTTDNRVYFKHEQREAMLEILQKASLAYTAWTVYDAGRGEISRLADIRHAMELLQSVLTHYNSMIRLTDPVD